MKCGPEKPAGARLFPPYRRAEQALEHLCLELRHNGIRTEQVEDRRMVLDDAPGPLGRGGTVAHVTVVVAQPGEPFHTLGEAAFPQAFLVMRGHFLEDDEE